MLPDGGGPDGEDAGPEVDDFGVRGGDVGGGNVGGGDVGGGDVGVEDVGDDDVRGGNVGDENVGSGGVGGGGVGGGGVGGGDAVLDGDDDVGSGDVGDDDVGDEGVGPESAETGGDAEAVYRYRVPPEESVSEAVVRAVASVTGRRAAGVPAGGGAATDALEPLYETVDPDALDALFRRDDGAVGGTVSFTYGGYEVTVESGAVVAVSGR